jgi:hypothetical protein
MLRAVPLPCDTDSATDLARLIFLHQRDALVRGD